MKRIILTVSLILCACSALPAQCPGGNCGRTYFWNPWGFYSYTASPCAGGKCGAKKPVKPAAAEPADPEPDHFLDSAKMVELKPFCLRVIELVNDARSKAGLPALTADNTLSQGCESHSRFMASYGFQHARGIGGFECIAQGVATPESVVRLWLNSSGHRAILLGRGSLIGVGCSCSFWTLRVR